jgi:uncharacterized protein YjiS (DUF1127 family)
MFTKIAERIRARKAYDRTYRELSRMDERQLADIGIGRSDIETIARNSF